MIAISRIDNAEVDLITSTGGLSSELVVKRFLLIILTCQVEQESEDLGGPTWKKMEKGAKLADASNPIIALKSRDELGVMKLLAKENVVAVCVAVTDKFMYGTTG